MHANQATTHQYIERDLCTYSACLYKRDVSHSFKLKKNGLSQCILSSEVPLTQRIAIIERSH